MEMNARLGRPPGLLCLAAVAVSACSGIATQQDAQVNLLPEMLHRRLQPTALSLTGMPLAILL